MESHVRAGLDDLSATQRRVLSLVAEGRTNAQIAQSLGISLDGAKWHVREILSKLNVDTREEAADAWREHSGLRRRLWQPVSSVVVLVRHLFAPAKVAVVAGVAIGAGVLAGIAVLTLVLLGRGPTETSRTPVPSAATLAQDQTRAASPVAGQATVHRYGPGETVSDESGVLLFNPATGGSEVWEVGALSRPSPSGRYIVIAGLCDDASGSSSSSCALPMADLLNTATGVARPLSIGAGRVLDARVTADEQRLVAANATSVALFSLPELKLLARSDRSVGAAPAGITFAYSADGNAIAVTRMAADPRQRTAELTDIVTEDRIITSPVAGMVAWAHHSRRVAVVGSSAGVIIDLRSGSTLKLARGHGGIVFNTAPEWSPDDRYVATAFSDAAAGVTSFDATTGAELVRVYGALGCPEVWNGTDTLQGSFSDVSEGTVEVPSGDIRSGWPHLPVPPAAYVGSNGEGVFQLVAADRQTVLASARILAPTSAPFGWSFEWPDGPPPTALMLSMGGRGICDGFGPAITVVLPPFAPSSVPTPTPSSAH